MSDDSDTNMNENAAQNRVQGMADQAKGKAKEAFGKATGDTSERLKGKGDQAKGKAKEGLADVENKIGNMTGNSNS